MTENLHPYIRTKEILDTNYWTKLPEEDKKVHMDWLLLNGFLDNIVDSEPKTKEKNDEV